MGLHRVLSLLTLSGALALAAPPEPQPAIRLPAAGVVPPPPAPAADAVVKLSGEQTFVVDSDVEFMIDAFPPGVVEITSEPGPVRMRAVFVDGTGKPEWRTFKGKHVATVNAVGTGRVTLVIVPVGAKSRADWVTQRIDANAGPQPPPVPVPPKPDPKPDPKPVPAPLADVAWAVVVYQSEVQTPEAAKVLGDTAYWTGLKSRGIAYRFYDADSPNLKGKNYLDYQTQAGGLPFLLLLDKDGKVLRVARLPGSTAGVDSLIGGK